MAPPHEAFMSTGLLPVARRAPPWLSPETMTAHHTFITLLHGGAVPYRIRLLNEITVPSGSPIRPRVYASVWIVPSRTGRTVAVRERTAMSRATTLVVYLSRWKGLRQPIPRSPPLEGLFPGWCCQVAYSQSDLETHPPAM